MINTSVPKGRKDAIRSITSLCRIKTPAPAFSLMEMMVVMLVVAVVMAISAPMITKKAGNSGGGSISLLTSISGGNIAYNLNGDTRSVIYGGNEDQITAMGDFVSGGAKEAVDEYYTPKLILNGKSPGKIGDNAQIGFMYDGSAIGTMLVGNNNRIYIGNRAEIGVNVTNAIAIGGNINAQNNSVLIGGMSSRTLSAASAVAIGHNVNAGSSTVTIGANARTQSGTPGFVAIGKDTIATTNGVAIGYAQAGGSGSVAISGRANTDDYAVDEDKGGPATSSGGVAIGYNAKAGGGLALGHNANSTENSCDAIGTGAVCGNTEDFKDALLLKSRTSMSLSGGNKFKLNSSNYASIQGSTTLSCTNNAVVVSGDKGLSVTGSSSANNVSATKYISASSVSANIGSFKNIDQMIKNLENAINSSKNNMNSIYYGIQYRFDYREVIKVEERQTRNCYCPKDEEHDGEGAREDGKEASGLAKFALFKKNSCCSCESSPMLAYNYTSDERLKDIIGENLDAIDKIERLKVYDFTFKDDESKTKRVGVIAQELQKIFPNAVKKGKDGYLHIRHEDIFYAMVNSLKELDARVKQLTESLDNSNKNATENKITVTELQIKVDTQDKDIKEMKEKLASLRKSVVK